MPENVGTTAVNAQPDSANESAFRRAPVDLTIVIPTFNERENVREIVKRLDRSLKGICWEAIFVDDCSKDGTGDVVREVASIDSRIRLILRHNRRGLSSAVVEGALAATAEFVAVMDGDLQHDEGVLPQLYAAVAKGDADISLASRFLTADGADGLSSKTRHQISNTGIKLANLLFGLKLTDPLTGFFVIRRSVVVSALPELSEIGFKVLLDFITAARPAPKVVEVPFKFRERVHGESKLDNRVMYDFFLFFVEKKISPFLPLPARFLSFALINSFGILIHLAALSIALNLFSVPFQSAVLVATVIAMAFNYWANNALTYRDRRLKGLKFYLGFLVFAGFSSVGIIANVGVASMMHEQYDGLFYLVPAALGALLTVVWNYVVTLAFVWGQDRAKGRFVANFRSLTSRSKPINTTHQARTRA
jgi:dolichol-phosphate mannosyltransferase